VNPRIISDAQVRTSDLQTSDLVLFGTKDTNAMIAKLADQLPMHLNRGADGYGLVYVYPVNGRYVLVSSGTPWFPLTDPPQPEGRGRGASAPGGPGGPAVRPGYDFLPPVQRALTKFQDYLLFKGSPDNVAAAGRFDHEWQLAPADADRLKASGVVTISTSRVPTYASARQLN
jgi:hypothetical protein